MLLCMLTGYAICFMNIAFIAESHCGTETTYGRVGQANTLIFLIVGTFVMLTTHIIIWLPVCAVCCKKREINSVMNEEESLNKN